MPGSCGRRYWFVGAVASIALLTNDCSPLIVLLLQSPYASSTRERLLNQSFQSISKRRPVSTGELVTEDDKALMAEVAATSHWADRTVDMLVAQIERQHRLAKRQELASRRGQRTFTLQALVAVGLLVVALALFVSTWDASLDRLRLLTALTAAPALAGAAASILRRLWEYVAGSEPQGHRSVWVLALLGCAAGAVAGLLYVVAQLTALVPGEQGQLPPVAGRLVPFALLTGFLAGFATDAFFRKIVENEPPSTRIPSFSVPSNRV